MSTYAYAKIFVYDKKGTILSPNIDINVNYIKNVLMGYDWPEELGDFNPSIKLPEITIDVVGLVKKGLLEDENFKKHIVEENEDSVLVDEVCEIIYYKEEGQILDINIKEDSFKPDKNFKILKRKNSNYNIVWVTEGILSTYVDKIKNNISKCYENLYNKKVIKSSVEYYKLNDEQKESLNDDIGYAEDDIEEQFDHIESLRQLIGALDSMKELYSKNYEDDVVAALYLC